MICLQNELYSILLWFSPLVKTQRGRQELLHTHFGFEPQWQKKNISFKFLDYNSNLIFFFILSTKDKKQGGKTWTFWQQNSMRFFFVGAIAKDFCFLTVGPSYNNMTEIPRFCFNQSHYRSAFGTTYNLILNMNYLGC